MNLSLQTQLSLRPLSIRKDKKHYIVEDTLSGDFFEMPKICVDAIKLLQDGEILGHIEDVLKNQYPEENVDMIEFAEQLLELQLIQAMDGQEITGLEKKHTPGGFQWVSPRIGQVLFNKWTNLFYLLVLLLNITLIVCNPKLFPRYSDIFLFDSMVLNLLLYMLISLVLILIHEWGHILAIRAHGLPAKLDIGNRLFFIVFETDLTPAWRLARGERNVLYFAGMAMEQSLVFIALMGKLLFPDAHVLFLGILGIVIFDVFIKTIYQCCFYMKTDMYYVFENVTGCYNLMESGKQFLSRWIPFMKVDSTTEAFEGEARIIRIYSIFYMAGLLLTLSLFSFYFLPQLFYAFSHIYSNLIHSNGSSAIWDAVIFLGQTFLLLGLLIYTFIRKRTHN